MSTVLALGVFAFGGLAVGLWVRPAPLPRPGRVRIDPALCRSPAEREFARLCEEESRQVQVILREGLVVDNHQPES